MDFMNKVNEIAQKVTDKTTELVEIGKLNAKIYSENNAVDDLKKQLGEICFGKYRSGDELDPEIEKLCAEIEKHKKVIAEHQRTLRQMKEADENTVNMKASGFCPYCGAELVKGANFCPKCGEKI